MLPIPTMVGDVQTGDRVSDFDGPKGIVRKVRRWPNGSVDLTFDHGAWPYRTYQAHATVDVLVPLTS